MASARSLDLLLRLSLLAFDLEDRGSGRELSHRVVDFNQKRRINLGYLPLGSGLTRTSVPSIIER
jgi:hypothetical protein